MTSSIGTWSNSTAFEINFEDFIKDSQESTMDHSVEKIDNISLEDKYSKLKEYFSNLKQELTSNDTHFDYINQVPKTFSACLKSDSFQSDVSKSREVKLMNLQAAGICLKILHLYLETPHATEVRKLIIQTSLPVLYEAYSHCKDSEIIYGDMFDDFTNDLGMFYKHIQTVQNAVLKCLDEAVSSNSFDIETESIKIRLIVKDVGKLSDLLICLDRMIAATLWKFFVKLISKYKDILVGNMQIDCFLLPLISDVENIIVQTACHIKSKEQVNDTDIKLCLVEISTIKKIVEIFQNNLNKEVVLQLRNFTLQLNKLLIICHSCAACDEQDLNVIKILLKAIRHVTIPFYNDKLFFSSTLHCQPEEVSADLMIPLLLLKLSILNYVNSTNEYTKLSKKGKILTEILSTLSRSKPEDDFNFVSIKIPSSFLRELENGNETFLTLYQHCYLSLTECSKHISESILTSDPFMEQLLRILNSCSDVCFLLISDVWTFYVRNGSVNRLFIKCVSLLEHLEEEVENARLELLLRRMIKFLPVDCKINLLEDYKNVYRLFCNHDIVHRFDAPNQNSVPFHVTQGTQVNFLLKELHQSDSCDSSKLIQKACSILKLGILCFESFSPEELLKFVEFLNTLFSTEIYEIQANALIFLKALKGKVLSKNRDELDKLTSTIAELLLSSLQSKNYIIRNDAFNVFICLAQTTPHSEMIKKPVIKSPSLIPSIKAYTEKVPSSGFLNEEEKHAIVEKHLYKFKSSNLINQFLPCETKQILQTLIM